MRHEKKVLVIEDNSDNLQLITYVLERSGYEVLAETSGEDGVEAAIREKPYFIIMDIMLPGIDGLETTRRIRASLADGQIPIIAMTSFAMSEDCGKALAAGCTGYFEKPIDPLAIMEDIHNIINKGS